MRRGSTALMILCLAACGDDGGPPAQPDARIPDPPDAGPAPVVEISSHDDGATILGSRDVTVAGVIDSATPIDDVVVTVDGVAGVATFDDTSFSAQVTLGDGSSAIVVTATSAGGSGNDAVDLVYPFVTLETFASASRVLGQPDFTTVTLPAAVDASTMPYPYGQPAWDGATLYVMSSDHNRVLGFSGFPATNDADASFVLGQPDLTTGTAGTGAGGMEFPQTVQVEGGRLYVLDWSGSRIMGWSTAPTTSGVPADFVVGQPDLDSAVTGCARDQVNFPDDFFVGAGRMIVSDTPNHRVLIWNSIPTASGALPDLVLGQADFTHCAANDDDQDGTPDGTPSARSLQDPIGIWSDGTRLFVVDAQNHRVLVWNSFPTASFTPADLVLGQADFTSNTPATTAAGLDRPKGISSNGNQLAITDHENNRVLLWSAMPTASTTPADVVLGQGSFTIGQANDDDADGATDAASARTMHGAAGVEFVLDVLAVTDIDNHRILFFGPVP